MRTLTTDTVTITATAMEVTATATGVTATATEVTATATVPSASPPRRRGRSTGRGCTRSGTTTRRKRARGKGEDAKKLIEL